MGRRRCNRRHATSSNGGSGFVGERIGGTLPPVGDPELDVRCVRSASVASGQSDRAAVEADLVGD